MIIWLNKIIKGLWYYEGKYKTTSGLVNMRGESLKELFNRQDDIIKRRIEDACPVMNLKDFMYISTDPMVYPHRISIINDIGGVLDRDVASNKLILTMYRIIDREKCND